MAVLRQGDRGIDVLFVQKALNLFGEKLVLDQVYGQATAAAVKRFQQRMSLKVDGIVGPQTFEAITTQIYQAGLPLDQAAIAAFQSRSSLVPAIRTQVMPTRTMLVPRQVQTPQVQDTVMYKFMSAMNQDVFMGLRVGHIAGLSAALLLFYAFSRKK